MAEEPRDGPVGRTSSGDHSGKVGVDELRFDFIKTSDFRDYFVDGVFGGVTPRGYIQMFVYHERGALPRRVFHAVNGDGTITEEIREKRASRNAIVRDVEANLIMDVQTAKGLLAWLAQKVALVEEANVERRDDRVETGGS